MDTPRTGRVPTRVAVFGGTGFIGRPLSAALEALGINVLRVARRTLPEGRDVVRQLDLASSPAQEIAELLDVSGVDVVVNVAGGMWGLTDDELVSANVTIVENVLSAVTSMPAPPRLVHLGSVHEYGLAPVGVSFTEHDVARPATTYGSLKLRCAQAVLTAVDAGQVDGVVLRAGNVTGPGQPPASLLGVVATELSYAQHKGRRARIEMTSLSALRDFVGLADAIGAIVTVATAPQVSDRILNIGTGQATSARELVRMLIEISGVPADLVETQPTTSPETMWQQLCVDRARASLGWLARQDLAGAVAELWADHTRAPRAAFAPTAM